MLLLPAGDRLLPRLALREGRAGRQEALDDLDQLLDDQTAVAHDRHVGPADLAQLGGIDVDVDDLRLGGEAGDLAGDAIVEAAAERDEQVGALHRGHGGVVAVHPRHAQAQRVRVGEGTPRHERGDDVDVAQLGQLSQRVGRPGFQDASPGVDHRALGAQDQLRRLPDLARVALGGRLVAGQPVSHLRILRPVPVHGGAGVLGVDDVLGDVEQHWTGPPGCGDVEGLPDRTGDVLGGRDQLVVLGDRAGDPDRVALLEGIGADGAGGHLAGDDDHRDRVHVGVAQRGDDVGRRRPGGDHGDTGTARDVRIALGHVAGALLVAHQDVPDGAVEQRVVHREDAAARKPEDGVHALHLEGFDECLRTVQLHVLGAFRSKTTTTSRLGGRERTASVRSRCAR